MNFCNFVQENLLKLLIITLLITILVLVIIHRYDKCKVKEGLDEGKIENNNSSDNSGAKDIIVLKAFVPFIVGVLFIIGYIFFNRNRGARQGENNNPH